MIIHFNDVQIIEIMKLKVLFLLCEVIAIRPCILQHNVWKVTRNVAIGVLFNHNYIDRSAEIESLWMEQNLIVWAIFFQFLFSSSIYNSKPAQYYGCDNSSNDHDNRENQTDNIDISLAVVGTARVGETHLDIMNE